MFWFIQLLFYFYNYKNIVLLFWVIKIFCSEIMQCLLSVILQKLLAENCTSGIEILNLVFVGCLTIFYLVLFVNECKWICIIVYIFIMWHHWHYFDNIPGAELRLYVSGWHVCLRWRVIKVSQWLYSQKSSSNAFWTSLYSQGYYGVVRGISQGYYGLLVKGITGY